MISLFSAIFLGSLKVPYDEIRRRIVEVDESQLSSEMLEQLLKFIPEPEQLQALAQLKDEIDSLAEPEQFCVVVRDPLLPLFLAPLFYFSVSHTRPAHPISALHKLPKIGNSPTQ